MTGDGKIGVTTVQHVTRLICQCGITYETPSKEGFGETDLGSVYSRIEYDWPRDKGWSFATGCASCTQRAEAEKARAEEIAAAERT